MFVFRSFMLLLWLFLGSTGHAAGDESVARVPAPNWAKVAEVGLNPESGADHGSYHYLLVDKQENLAEDATYEHLAIQLLTEDGVKDFSQLEFEFQPEYEKLEIHHIRIIRDGVVQERLPGTTFEVIRREKDMQHALFDGSMTAFTILEDVRPGDILSYSYTSRGVNPIFAGNRHGFVRLGFNTPIDLMRRRLLWDPAKTKLRWHTLGVGVQAPDFHPGSPLDEVEWKMNQVPAVDVEDDTPGYFISYPSLEWSSYPDWAAFGDWALKIYPEPGVLPEELVSICAGIRAGSKSPEEEIVKTLRWVQRNVRYLGSFLDEHTHAPYALDEILRRRFGDCKDKGVLTVAMLRHLGFDAAPALVNTSRRKSIAEYLPGHYCFNHLIVHLIYKEKDYFLDPTYTFQRGKLEKLDFPDYGFAFLVRPGQSALYPLKSRGKDVDKLTIEEFYDIRSFVGDAFLTVRTVATGGEANSLRQAFSDESVAELGKSYQKFYGRFHQGIELASPIEFEDDEERNRIMTTERYRIPEFWKKTDKGQVTLTAELRPNVLEGGLEFPEKQNRSHPYWISYPKSMIQIVDVTFPEEWNTRASSNEIEHPAFSYKSKVTPRARGYRSEYHYTSLTPEVQAKDFQSYRKSMIQLSDDLTLSLSHKVPDESSENPVAAGSPRPSDFSYLLVGASVFMGLLGGLGLGVWMYCHDPAPRPSLPRDPQGLGGWLILPVISTVLAPIILLTAVSSYFTKLGGMSARLDAESTFGSWRQYYVAGAFGNALMLIPAVVLIVLMFRRRSGFPFLFVVTLVANVILLGVLYSMEKHLDGIESPADGGNTLTSLFQLFLWGSYMFNSRRVKATFIQRLRPAPPPRHAED